MTINLLDTYKYWKNLPHQNNAIDELDLELRKNHPSLLQNFAYDWRNNGNNNVSDNDHRNNSNSSPLSKIISRMKQLGMKPDTDYLDKDPNHYRLTIVGLEGLNKDFTLNSDAPDKFNDVIVGLKLWGNGKVTMTSPFAGTTEPGAHYTRYAMNKKGAARVCIDEKHPDIWQLGYHFKEPDCLVQTGNSIRVTRDYNKDGSRTGDKVEKGYFGINFHHGYDRSYKGSIGKTSAGCTVIPKRIDFYRFINDHVKNDIAFKRLGKEAKFSYILLDASKIF